MTKHQEDPDHSIHLGHYSLSLGRSLSQSPFLNRTHQGLWDTHTRTTCTLTVHTHSVHTHTYYTHTYSKYTHTSKQWKNPTGASPTAEYLMVYMIFYVGAATLVSVPLWFKTREGELEQRSCGAWLTLQQRWCLQIFGIIEKRGGLTAACWHYKWRRPHCSLLSSDCSSNLLSKILGVALVRTITALLTFHTHTSYVLTLRSI